MSKTTLSIRDFAILYGLVNHEIANRVNSGYYCRWDWPEEEKEHARKEHLDNLAQDSHYQNLLRIRDKLGELNIEIETPDVEIKE